ncbi:MAG: flavodoxin [Alistipes sp.]|nr:flavodoxin [Alistipes sp.]
MKHFVCSILGALSLVSFAASAADNAATALQSTENTNAMKTNRRTLVAYFSHTGENYAVGVIEKGNTAVIAEMIAEATGGTLFEIVPVEAYPATYNECIAVAKAEKESGARPAVQGDVAVEDYDTIFIGYPNWWGDMPMAVYTFIEKHRWQGKTVIPFCTHEGSGLSSTERRLADACKGATVAKGLAVKGTTAQNKRDQARSEVRAWLAKVF